MRLIRILRTSTFRLALLYVALFGLSVLFLLAFLYWATVGYMARQTDETIAAEISGLAEQFRQRGLEGLARSIGDRIARNPQGTSIYLLADPSFRSVIGNIDRWPVVPESTDGWLYFTMGERDSRRVEAFRARARHFELPGGHHLLVGRDVEERENLQRLIAEAFAWGVAITVALALAGGLFMSWSTIQKIEAINRTSREIMRGDLSRRVPTTGTGDDFDQLAQNLNGMLDQIEILMAAIREVSNNIAHDLRSPLTRMRSRLELARLQNPDPDQYRALIDETIAEADTLLSTFNALLRIAEIEAGNRRRAFAEIDLAALVRDAVELYEPVAQERRQTLTARIECDGRVVADSHLLSQTLANLIDNAIKYAPEDSRIIVGLRHCDGGLELSVADNGPGIPTEFRDKVLQRFYRLEHSRSTPGSGLGLSLVAAVARLHNARLVLDDNLPGLRVTLAFAEEKRDSRQASPRSVPQATTAAAEPSV